MKLIRPILPVKGLLGRINGKIRNYYFSVTYGCNFYGYFPFYELFSIVKHLNISFFLNIVLLTVFLWIGLLTLLYIVSRNGQTLFKNLVANAARFFEVFLTILGHCFSICIVIKNISNMYDFLTIPIADLLCDIL